MRCKCNASLQPWLIEKQLGKNSTSFQFFLCENVWRCQHASAILTPQPLLPTMGHSRSASNRRVCTSCFMTCFCASRSAATRMLESSWKIACANSLLSRTRRRLPSGSLSGGAGPSNLVKGRWLWGNYGYLRPTTKAWRPVSKTLRPVSYGTATPSEGAVRYGGKRGEVEAKKSGVVCQHAQEPQGSLQADQLWPGAHGSPPMPSHQYAKRLLLTAP